MQQNEVRADMAFAYDLTISNVSIMRHCLSSKITMAIKNQGEVVGLKMMVLDFGSETVSTRESSTGEIERLS